MSKKKHRDRWREIDHRSDHGMADLLPHLPPTPAPKSGEKPLIDPFVKDPGAYWEEDTLCIPMAVRVTRDGEFPLVGSKDVQFTLNQKENLGSTVPTNSEGEAFKLVRLESAQVGEKKKITIEAHLPEFGNELKDYVPKIVDVPENTRERLRAEEKKTLIPKIVILNLFGFRGSFLAEVKVLTEEGNPIPERIVRLEDRELPKGFLNLEKTDENGFTKTKIKIRAFEKRVRLRVLDTWPEVIKTQMLYKSDAK